jgi:O-antigen/teichoic acid export membrane protein
MQQKRKMRLLGHAQSLRALVTALGAVMSLGIFRSMEASLLTTVVLSSLVLVTFECRSAEIQRERGKRSWIDQVWACGGLLVQAVPVGSAAFLVAISTSFPRLVISRTLGETVLGVFAVVCYLAFPATLVSSALMQAALPRLTHSVKDSPTLARKLLWKLFVVNAFLASVNGCLLVGPGPFLVSWLLESSDSLPDGLLGLLAVAVGISYLANVPATALVASRQFRLSLMSCGVSCFVAVCASLILIPVWGIRGAPVAMIFASFTHLMGTTASLHWSWQNDSCDRSEVRPVVTRRAA